MIVVTIEQGLDGDLCWRCWGYDNCVRMLMNECSGSAIKNIRRDIAEQCNEGTCMSNRCGTNEFSLEDQAS